MMMKKCLAAGLAILLTVSMAGCELFQPAPTAAPTVKPTEALPTAEPSTAPTTEAPTVTPSTAEPSTEAPTEEPSMEEPTEEPTTEAPTEEPIVYDPVSVDMAIGEIVPASLHQGGDNANALNVTYDSPIGTVSALRDGNFYYMFLPKGSPDTLAISVTGQAIRSVNPGTLYGNVVQLTYDGVTTVELKLENGRSVYVILMRSSVPALHVVLNQVSLATVHADKRIKYPGNSVFLYDPDNSNNNVAANEVEFKGRGNSSWTRYAKKGYQIKFEKRVSILGMEPAKKWILIPDAGDGSLIRNKLALEIAAASGCFAYTPHGEFVDLWISGEYRGLYAISEKVEIDKNRLALSDPKGVLVELDELFYGEDPYRTSGLTGHHYVEKEAVDETSHEGIDRFMDAMTDLERMLVTHAPWESVEKAIDVPSFAAYYIIQEFTHNAEDLYTSFFLYRDGENDVIHAGPVWDFDSCFGMFEQDPYPNTIMSFISTERRHSNIFYQLGRYPEFRVITQQIYDTCFRDQIASLIEDTTRVYYEIKNSADMNFRKYAGTLGNATWKGNVVLPTFEENYISFQGWLTARLENFVPYHFFTELSARVVQLKVSAEGILLTDFEPAGPDDPSENGTDSASAETQPAETQPPETTPPETTPAETQPPETAPPETQPSETQSPETQEAGPGSGSTVEAPTEPSSEEPPAPPVKTYEIPCVLVTHDPNRELKGIRVAIWTVENGQDDLAWYYGAWTGSEWLIQADLSNHPGTEMNLRFYGTTRDGKDRLLISMHYVRPAGAD